MLGFRGNRSLGITENCGAAELVLDGADGEGRPGRFWRKRRAAFRAWRRGERAVHPINDGCEKCFRDAPATKLRIALRRYGGIEAGERTDDHLEKGHLELAAT